MPIRITPTVKFFLISCLATFIVQQTVDRFFGGNLLGWLALVPASFVLEYRVWQLFTYVFLHGDVMHLFLNLMMIAFIGGELEASWGKWRFTRFFFICSSAGGLLYLFLQMLVWKGEGLYAPMVGASGGIYGLLMAYGILFGERVLLFMMLFPMKAKHFVWILAAIEFMTTLFSGRSGLASAAHLGGMVAGIVTLWATAMWRVRQKRRQQGWMDYLMGRAKRPPGGPGSKKKPHLKLVINNEKELDRTINEDDDSESDPKTWH